MTAGQPVLFGDPIPAGPYPRAAAVRPVCAAEYVNILPGVWAVCVFTRIPKMGFQDLDFPHYWGRLDDDGRIAWRVARHGDVPDRTFTFTSREDAAATVVQAFGRDRDLHPFMGWIEIPSDDHRRASRQER